MDSANANELIKNRTKINTNIFFSIISPSAS